MSVDHKKNMFGAAAKRMGKQIMLRRKWGLEGWLMEIKNKQTNKKSIHITGYNLCEFYALSDS